MRSLVVLTLMAGCVRNAIFIQSDELVGLRRAGQTQPLIVHDVDGDGVRIDPSSKLRLQRADGSFTPWLDGHTLRVSGTGVVVRTTARIDSATAAVIAGLDPADVEALTGHACGLDPVCWSGS